MRKYSNIQNLLKLFVRVRLWEPYVRNAKIIGCHHVNFGDTVSCVVEHAKLPNLVIVAVHLLLEKNESLLTTGRKMLQ